MSSSAHSFLVFFSIVHIILVSLGDFFFCFVADSRKFFVYFKRNKNTAPDRGQIGANLQLVALRLGVSHRTLRLDRQDEVGM